MATAGPPLLDATDQSLSAGFAAQVNAFQDDFARRGGCPVDRGFHVKRHVAREIRFRVVDDLPARATGGIFVPGAEYAGWLRISNGYSGTLPDWFPDLVGFAVKLRDIPGPKLLPGERHARDAGLSGVEPRLYPCRWPAGYGDDIAGDGQFLHRAVRGGERARPAQDHQDIRVAAVLAAPAAVAAQSAGLGYAGLVPISIGDVPIKFHWRPQGLGTGPAFSGPDRFRAAIANRLASGEVRFDFLAQFFVDAQCTPIDGAYAWPDAVAPLVKLGELIIPQGEPAPAALEEWVNRQGFNPWHALVAHRPLGNIQRVRGAVYQASARHRGAVVDP